MLLCYIFSRNLPERMKASREVVFRIPYGLGRDRIRGILKAIMTKSKRTRHWYSLNRQERGLYSLALSLDIKFNSIDLMRALVSIVKKLRSLADGLYSRLVRGTRLAWIFSDAAVRWGNAEAKEWRHDRNYVIYLAALMGGGRWF